MTTAAARYDTTSALHTGRYLLAMAFACCAWGAQAQVSSAKEVSVVSVPQHHAAETPVVDRWWVLFTEPVALDLGLSDQDFTRLRELDTRFYDAYWDLGDEPSRHPRYVEISEQRNAAVKTVLSQEQFRRWSKRYDPLRARR